MVVARKAAPSKGGAVFFWALNRLATRLSPQLWQASAAQLGENEMADNKVIASGKSREEVAFDLMRSVCFQEGKRIDQVGSGADRAYILRTYYECLLVASGVKP